MMRLIDSTTKQEVHVGDTVTTFRGEKVILLSFTARKVYVQPPTGFQREYFPSVIRCEIENRP